MSVRSFRPVIAVATVAGAALSCYLVSLRVASERAHLEDVETKIVLAQRDIRTLQTEIGTRGRLEQLERWNVKVLALSAPKADQFVDGGYQLARLTRPSDEIHMDAPIVLASAPKPAPSQPVSDGDADIASTSEMPAVRTARAAPRNDGPASMLHVASYAIPAKATSALPPAKASTIKISHKSSETVSATTKLAKIATVFAKSSLPKAHADAKASVTHDPARKQAGTIVSRDKATH